MINSSFTSRTGNWSSALLRGAFFLALSVLANAVVPPARSWSQEDGGFVGGDRGEQEFPEGATLKLDPDLEMKLDRAEIKLEEGRVDLAVVLWQYVLDKSSDTVMTRDGWVDSTFNHKYRRYKSIAAEIERAVSNLPPEGLRIYRVTADAEAKEILAAGAENREAALAEVVRRFFLSSIGDDAAYELACRQLDRYDFVGASRLLSKIIEEHPDPSIPREQVMLRLAVANARVGDLRSAEKALEAAGSVTVPTELIAQVSEEIAEAGGGSPQAASAADGWPMRLGGPARNRAMKPLPPSATANTLTEWWEQREEFNPTAATIQTKAVRRAIVIRGRRMRTKTVPAASSREQLVERWKENGWMPAGHVLMHDGLLYFKMADRRTEGFESVTCCDAETGEMRWLSRPYYFQLDPVAQRLANPNMNAVVGDRPRSRYAVKLFGDRVFQGMSIVGDRIYVLEGRLAEVGAPEVNQNAYRHGYNQGIPRRGRRTWLATYEAKTGRFKWRRSAHESEAEAKYEIGFLAAPVPFGELLIVPVADSGGLWLYALASRPSNPEFEGHAGKDDSGRTIWKTFLCDEPASGASHWSPVGLAVDGGDVYVSTGAGVVFALDALSGNIRWAVRYQRSAKPGITQSRYPYQPAADVSGWDEDVVIPAGRQLIVLASDFDQVLALDRRTGEHLWESPRVPVEGDPEATYCLGVTGKSLFVGGPRIVRRYDIAGGSLIWEKAVEASYGRGCLTADALYLPVKDSIMKIDPETGKNLAQVGVTTPTREPVGNLYTDGDHFYAVGMGRVYALAELSHRLSKLEKQISGGDPDSQIERMRLRLRMEKLDEAIADMRGAYQLIHEQEGSLAAQEALFDAMDELGLPERRPGLVLDLIVAAHRDAAPAQGSEELDRQRDGLFYRALQSVEQDPQKAGAQQVLQAAELLRDERLLDMGRRAVAAASTEEDRQSILDALASSDARRRVAAAAGIAKALDEEQAREKFAALLKDKDARVRLASAKALANIGDRQSLRALAELLEADELMIRVRSAQALRALTGKRFNFAAYESSEKRAGAAIEWSEWIEKNGDSAKLNFPLDESAYLLGRTLICYYGQNKVIELDESRKKIWEQAITQPWGCQGLPNGHRVIASYQARSITEFDEKGKKVWEATGLPGRPFSVQQLTNGNFLVPFYSSNKVVEISRESRKPVWEKPVSGNPMDARRLPNGNTLVCLMRDSKVVEFDPDWKVVWSVGNMFRPRSAQRLENGNTLISQTNGGRVVEVTRDKKQVVWKYEGLSSPFDAQRLPNGNTLIVDSKGIREIGPTKEQKILWEKTGGGVSRVCRY